MYLKSEIRNLDGGEGLRAQEGVKAGMVEPGWWRWADNKRKRTVSRRQPDTELGAQGRGVGGDKRKSPQAGVEVESME